MLRYILTVTCLSFIISLTAQVPQGIKYQAVARDSTGSVLVNTDITLRVSVIDSAAKGSIPYSEIHKANTNQTGLFNISIGQGVSSKGQFADIDWSTGGKWLQLAISLDDGASFTLVSTSELLSVPYALFAGAAANCVQRPDTAKINYPSVGYWSPPTRQECCFDPDYPDGMDGIRGINQLITDSTYYVVPQGKNLHITFFAPDSTHWPYRTAYVVINGTRFRGNPYPTFPSEIPPSSIIVGAGDSVSGSLSPNSSGVSGSVMFGYLINAKVVPVNVNLKDGPYVVPNGKQFFLTFCSNEDDNLLIPVIKVNGRTLIGNFAPVMPIILRSGETISAISNGMDTYLNGYLK